MSYDFIFVHIFKSPIVRQYRLSPYVFILVDDAKVLFLAESARHGLNRNSIIYESKNAVR